MDKTIIIATALGAVLYFLMEFKSKKFAWGDFKVTYWIKDNWYNVALTGVCLWAYLYIKEGLNKEAAFMLGFGINKTVDYMQDFLSKKTI